MNKDYSTISLKTRTILRTRPTITATHDHHLYHHYRYQTDVPSFLLFEQHSDSSASLPWKPFGPVHLEYCQCPSPLMQPVGYSPLSRYSSVKCGQKSAVCID